ncbi:MAG: hypothetical protein ACOX5G_08125 [Kiritimatiellia bacterium]
MHDVRAISKGQTNDDLVALNADDSLERVENRDLSCGPIENIVFSDLYAEDCHTGIRLLSVRSTIRNIRFRNVNVGVRCFAVNADAAPLLPHARSSRTPISRMGWGRLDRIEFDGIRVHATFPHVTALFLFESNMAGVRMRDIVRDTRERRRSLRADSSRPPRFPRLVRVADRFGTTQAARRAGCGWAPPPGNSRFRARIAELSVSSTAPVPRWRTLPLASFPREGRLPGDLTPSGAARIR